ncbi:MAG: DUF4855 domain-containing protein [Bacteroidales bacterium]|nr:DUF4855 domain-containing protein [Bacteroidales bacterium]
MIQSGLKYLLCIASVACMIACVQEQADPDLQGETIEMTFTGYADDERISDTKSTLHTDGVSVHWSDEDRITVFAGSATGVVSEKASVHSDRRSADFTVKTTLADAYHALYPAYDNAAYSTDYDYIVANIPTQQAAVGGSFADGVNLAIAKSEGSNLYFRNVGALLAVKNPTNYAGSIKIMSRDASVKMTGETNVSYNEGNPKVVSSANAVNYVEFKSDLTNTKDQIFNAVVYPGNYASGFDIIISSSGSPYLCAVYSSTKALDLKRNDNYLLFSLPDGKFSWNSIAGPTSVTTSYGGWQAITVSWAWNYTVNAGETDPRSGYVVYVRDTDTNEIVKQVTINSPATMTTTVTGLAIDKAYDFGVQVTKMSGKASEIVWAEDVWVAGNKCTPPTPLTIEQISETQVTLTWKDNTGAEKNYMFWKEEIRAGEKITNTATLAANITTYTTSVNAGSTYKFGIQAIHKDSAENDSDVVYFDDYTALTWEDLQKVDMGDEDCLEPVQVTVSLASESSVGQKATITWECYSGAATGFRVYYRESTDPEWTKAHYENSSVSVGKDIRTYTFGKVFEYGKSYIIGVQALHGTSASRNSDIVNVGITVVKPSTSKYDWEADRTAVPTWADMTLCYGGNPNRSPYLWDKERWASHALYTDENGQMHYLFDTFLALEFSMGNYTLNYDDSGNPSARKQEWSQLINYWFDSTYGFQALDDCIAEAAAQIGAPKTKRYVVFVLPDPIYCSTYTNKSSSTKYWGTLENGSTADFSTAAGRVEGYKWMIDQVRARFAAKDYKYIELAGFYILQETLSASYNNQYKYWKTMLQEVAEYCHGYYEGLYWIPYGYSVSGISGYDAGHNTAIQNWQSYYGFDLAILQPNKYWDYSGNRSWETTCSTYIDNYNMGMEIEFEGTHGEDLATSSSILTYRRDGTVNSEAYNNRVRLREYFTNAQTYGIYGKRPIVLYSGTDGMHELAISNADNDEIIYHELCQFIINSPLKNANTVSATPDFTYGGSL